MLPGLTRVALLGAGRAGKKMLSLLQNRSEIVLTAVYDQDPEAPGLALAWDRNIPTVSNLDDLIATDPEVVINVTGDPAIGLQLARQIPPQTRMLDGEATRLVLALADIQHRVQEELRQALRDQQILYFSGLTLTSAGSLDEVLSHILEQASSLLDIPAGSIALYDDTLDEFRMVASKGLSSDFLEEVRGSSVRKGGLNEFILQNDAPASVEDALAVPDLINPILSREGIRSILACPLRAGARPVGILYLDDFKARKFSERDKSLISLFSSQAAIAIEKFRLVDRVHDANRYLESILNDSGDMIMTTDTAGRIVRFNRGGEQILGYSPAEVIGRSARDFYAEPTQRDKILEELNRSGEVRNREIVLLRKDDTQVDISLTISSLRNDRGEPVGTVGISKDVTHEKFLRQTLEERNRELSMLTDKLEEKVIERTRELERINNELERANRLKSRFIANMSHELRTPLNSIIGFAEIIQDSTYGELSESQRRYAENIGRSGHHLLQLVNNILDLAKIEAGRLELDLQRCALQELVEEVAAVMRALSEQKAVAVTLEFEPNVPDFEADRVKIKQILYNLISNAIKFTPEGGSVRVQTDFVCNDAVLVPWAPEGQEFFTVKVSDTGVGIKPEDLERIFDEFEQADSSYSRDFEGAGLGLALSKRLAELHGGHITAESTLNRGSTFTLFVPRHTEEHAHGQETAGLKGELCTLPDSSLARLSRTDSPLVLVVEDDLPTSEILTIHMTQAGYRVAHAYNGEEAIQKATELKPFLITLDVMLPRKDGWEVLQALKSRNETKDIPVIVHSIIDNRELAFSLGAADYILKPVDKDTLLERISDVVRHYRRDRRSPSVLVVSMDQTLKAHIEETLSAEGFVIHTAERRSDAVELASATRPGVILLEAVANDTGDSLKLLFELKTHAITRDIPIFLLADGELSVEERVELSGKIERILQKDAFQPVELLSHLRDMEVSYPDRAGLMDEVTGTFNHRYFQIRLAQELLRARRYSYPLALVLLQIDSFDAYLQCKGEYYGNIVLRKTADLIRKNIRGSDVLVRYRSSTLAVILPNTPLSSAHALAKRFLSVIEAYPFLHEEEIPRGKLTASGGITALRKNQSPEEMTRYAEGSLLRAITLGGNRAEIAESLA